VALDERSLHELDDLSHLMDEQAHLEQSSTWQNSLLLKKHLYCGQKSLDKYLVLPK
jgi:hypothetical protein